MNTSTSPKPVIVGYDGSDGSQRAVRWAAQHASVTGLPLLVAHCTTWPLFTDDLGPVEGIKDSGLQNAAERTVSEGVELAAQVAPDLKITQRLLTGFPADVLTKLSADASLLVTGTRGLGGFAGLLVGSVSLHLTASASCPIAVVREDQPAEGSVLVAVDGSPESDRAVLIAAGLAEALNQSLHLLHILPYRRHPADVAANVAADSERDPVIQQSRNLLPTDTKLTIAEEATTATSTPGAIIERARTASCVVLGAKGRNTLGARLGSTVHAVLHHTTSNVIVVR
ncbi:universal stress protein [Arthrobacter pityocampae]|uniref:Universal stress protein n=1 Tax=Arthrobacter pityocampae TaxID=547334 RepID=A0A2S5IV21_9MICC|nr:universal stress protein [Arthrobacter pityocampae]PPB48391.1 universal stress protein [Arthrobacter pityocampae]